MDFNFLGQNTEEEPKKKRKDSRFSGSITGAILVFMLITALYLVFANPQAKLEEVGISEVAQSVALGEVAKILVAGENLTITYQNGEEKKSKKEAGSSLSQTLAN